MQATALILSINLVTLKSFEPVDWSWSSHRTDPSSSAGSTLSRYSSEWPFHRTDEGLAMREGLECKTENQCPDEHDHKSVFYAPSKQPVWTLAPLTNIAYKSLNHLGAFYPPLNRQGLLMTRRTTSDVDDSSYDVLDVASNVLAVQINTTAIEFKLLSQPFFDGRCVRSTKLSISKDSSWSCFQRVTRSSCAEILKLPSKLVMLSTEIVNGTEELREIDVEREYIQPIKGRSVRSRIEKTKCLNYPTLFEVSVHFNATILTKITAKSVFEDVTVPSIKQQIFAIRFIHNGRPAAMETPLRKVFGKNYTKESRTYKGNQEVFRNLPYQYSTPHRLGLDAPSFTSGSPVQTKTDSTSYWFIELNSTLVESCEWLQNTMKDLLDNLIHGEIGTKRENQAPNSTLNMTEKPPLKPWVCQSIPTRVTVVFRSNVSEAPAIKALNSTIWLRKCDANYKNCQPLPTVNFTLTLKYKFLSDDRIHQKFEGIPRRWIGTDWFWTDWFLLVWRTPYRGHTGGTPEERTFEENEYVENIRVSLVICCVATAYFLLD